LPSDFIEPSFLSYPEKTKSSQTTNGLFPQANGAVPLEPPDGKHTLRFI